MFDCVPEPFVNEANIAKDRLFLLAQELREIQGERMDFPDTTDVQLDSPWHKRKTKALSETRDLFTKLREYEMHLPFDPAFVDDEHLTSVMHSLADMTGEENTQVIE